MCSARNWPSGLGRQALSKQVCRRVQRLRLTLTVSGGCLLLYSLLGGWVAEIKKRYIHCVFRISFAMCVCFLFLCASVFYSSWCNHITGRPCSQWWWAGDRWRNYRTYHESIFIAVAASIILVAPCLKKDGSLLKSS